MTDKDKDLRICPFRLAANPKVPPYFAGMSDKDKVALMKVSLCCFKELCQWWWLCSGNTVYNFLSTFEILFEKLLKMVEEKDAKER